MKERMKRKYKKNKRNNFNNPNNQFYSQNDFSENSPAPFDNKMSFYRRKFRKNKFRRKEIPKEALTSNSRGTQFAELENKLMIGLNQIKGNEVIDRTKCICDQICDELTKKCECYTGYMLQKDGKTCKGNNKIAY